MVAITNKWRKSKINIGLFPYVMQ